MANNTDFTLQRDAYATFDALTLKNLIKNRLRAGGVFTDQDFEGSNLSALVDIIAYSYHLSLFYLNQTSSEALFDEATAFENINRITKLIGYKPVGYKSSVLSFEAIASQLLSRDIYTIKRFSYFTINGIFYSFIKDATFSKTLVTEEPLTSLSNDNLLYQGKFFENPAIQAVGEEFETLTLVVKDNINNKPVNIEHNSLNVFVKSFGTGKYSEYTEIDSVFNANSSDKVFEKRLNENGFYELRFGNGVNGTKLTTGDLVSIYYLKSDGESGVVSPGTLDGSNLNIFTTTLFETISKDIYESNLSFLTPERSSLVAFSNKNASTRPSTIENVARIKENAPKSFYAQNRIVTNQDFQTFISQNYSNIVSSSILVNNESFIDNVVKYYYDLGLDRPNLDSRFLFNQVKFSTSNQSNSVYAFMVPRIKAVDSENNLFFLTQSQKSEIINATISQKMINAEVIPMDPVYTGVSVGLQSNTLDTPKLEDLDSTFLVVERLLNDRISSIKIQELVSNIFINEYAIGKAELGSTINVNDITAKILNIEGVVRVKTRKVNANTGILEREIPFLNLYNFNAAYPSIDINSSGSNVNLPYFKFPFLYNGSIKDRILVETVDS